jgi:thiol:disulfide interchange protein DsbD
LWLLATAAWLHGQAQRGVTGFRAAAWVTLAAALALLGPVWNAGHTATDTRFADARAWSPQRVGALQADGRPVFVNFTAAWCITCKVNEQVALERPDVKRLMHERGITYLKGDWTRRDARIAEELSRHGRSGVPLYLAFPGRPGAPPQVLPQILTEDVVIAALERL